MKTLNSNSTTEILTRQVMKNVMGGGEGLGGGCFVRCDQDSTEGTSVGSCLRENVEKVCGEDLSNAVCVCA